MNDMNKTSVSAAALAIFLYSTVGPAARASETVAPSRAGVANSSTLPLCVNNKSELDEIETAYKLKNTPMKYDRMKKALESDSDETLQARLVYAETLAAHCPEFNQMVASPIAAVVRNRLRVQNGDARKVVFQKDQFASSVNIYDIDGKKDGLPPAKSNWKEFLCPSDEKTWGLALEAVRAKKSDLPSDVYNYYLFRHSGRFVPKSGSWPLKDAVKFEGHEKFLDCVKFVKLGYP